jgi:hypothetical protein
MTDARIAAAQGVANLPQPEGTMEVTNPVVQPRRMTITLLAQSAQLPATAYATFGTRNAIGFLEFDAAAQESARWVLALPSGFTYTGGVTLELAWTSGATSGSVRWGGRIARLTGVDIDSDTYDTAVEATTAASATPGTVVTTSLSSVGVDSATAGEFVMVEIYRDVTDSADTVNADDALLLGVRFVIP